MSSGLYRSASHMSSLNQLAVGVAMPIEALTSNKTPDMVETLAKNVMNDIPNVIAYRDSRFVRQELRIGNHLMDTGRVMEKQRVKFRAVQSQQEIKLMVTSPENELIDVEEGVEMQAEDGMRRNESEPLLLNRSLSALITENSLGLSSSSTREATKLLWGSEPVKETVPYDQWRHWERGIEISEETRFDQVWRVVDEGRGQGSSQAAFVRRGLFTKSGSNNMPKSYNHLMLRRARPVGRRRSGQGSGMLELREDEDEQEGANGAIAAGDVVFVLGDNEQLVNLRQQSGDGDEQVVVVPLSSTPKKKTHCCKHKAKKHSGVKFNFEQYPQIVENYMRNKNFAMEGSEILAKAIKMERVASGVHQEGHSRAVEMSSSQVGAEEEEEECECCAGFKSTGELLQTPSNASELDLEYDNYGQTTAAGKAASQGISGSSNGGAVPKQQQQQILNQMQMYAEPSYEMLLRVVALPLPNVQEEEKALDRGRLPVIASRGGVGEADSERQKKNPFSVASKWGMVPSLMLGVTDHYVPDMVLQGIRMETQQQQWNWEVNLRQDLTLSAHCATIEQVPTENVAIVANVDDWEVRIVSSNGQTLGAAGMGGGGERDAGCLVSYSTSGEFGILIFF